MLNLLKEFDLKASILAPFRAVRSASTHSRKGGKTRLRGLVFSYGNAFTAPYVDAITSTLAGEDVELTLVETESNHFFDPDRAASYKGRNLFISDHGFHTLPTFNADDYIAICGDDIDFLAIRSLDLWRAKLPFDQDVLDPESPIERSLRGVALRVEAMLLAMKPDFVVIPHGADHWTRVVTAKARKLDIPCIYWESSFFPGRVLLDAKGPHFLPGASQMAVDAANAKQTTSPQERANAEQYLQTWIANRHSKHVQLEEPAELQAFEAFKARFPDLIFVPMQLPQDASVFGSSIFYKDMFDFCRDVVETAPDGFGIVFKVHPYMTDQDNFNWTEVADIFERPNVIRVSKLSIHDLIPKVRVVTALTSNVGLEAAIYGVPVVVGGAPVYAGRGFTLDRSEQNSLRDLFQAALGASVDRASLVAFIAQLFKTSLIKQGDTEAGRQFIQRALRLVRTGHSRAPFAEFEPTQVKAYLSELTKQRLELR